MTDAQFVFAIAVLITAAAAAGFAYSRGEDHGMPDPELVEWTPSHRRKRDAKLHNEQIKLGATLWNNLSIALVVAIFVAPAMRGEALLNAPLLEIALAAALVFMLHMFAQLTLRFWRSEE